MPLLVTSKPYNGSISSIHDFLDEHPCFKSEAERLKSAVPRAIDASGLLYINQREYAVVSPNDDDIKIIGSDDATTCHLVIIRHTGSGVTGLAHCDGCDTEKGLQDMVRLITTRSHNYPNGRLEVTLIGGFIDKRNESENLSQDIIDILHKLSESLHLVGACITDYNNTQKNGINFPVIYGIAVDVKSGDIFPATFPEKGPELDVRSACHFGGFKHLINIYDYEQHHLVIGPYAWHPLVNISKWVTAPDFIIRKYLSTSPDQEPPSFETHVRNALKVLLEHPDPSQTLFPGGTAHRYFLNEEGIWVKVTDG